MESATARLATGAVPDRIGEPGLLVDHDVVGAVDAVVVEGLLERDRLAPEAAQLAQVENLDAVGSGPVGHDVDVIAVDLHVPPDRAARARRLREVAHVDRVRRIAEVDERRAVRASHDRVLGAALRVGPSPDVVHAGPAHATDLVDGHERDDVDALAFEDVRAALRALDLVARDRREAPGLVDDRASLDPRREDHRGARPLVHGERADRHHVVAGRHRPAERRTLAGRPAAQQAHPRDTLRIAQAVEGAGSGVRAGRAHEECFVAGRDRRAELRVPGGDDRPKRGDLREPLLTELEHEDGAGAAVEPRCADVGEAVVHGERAPVGRALGQPVLRERAERLEAVQGVRMHRARRGSASCGGGADEQVDAVGGQRRAEGAVHATGCRQPRGALQR